MSQNAKERRILILEDEEPVRAALERAFREHTAYQFEIKLAESPEACVDHGYDREVFDIYLIDLDLKKGTRPFFGHTFIAVRAPEVPEAVTIVYSRHARAENVVSAIRQGAQGFIVKGECNPHQVPDEVVKLLDRLQAERQRYEELSELADRMAPEWHEEYAGKVITVVGQQVVDESVTRLQAAIQYEVLRQEHPEWPAEPQLVYVPVEAQV